MRLQSGVFFLTNLICTVVLGKAFGMRSKLAVHINISHTIVQISFSRSNNMVFVSTFWGSKSRVGYSAWT